MLNSWLLAHLSDQGSGLSNNATGAVYLISFLDDNFSGATLEATVGKGYSGGKNYNVSALDNYDNFGSSLAFNDSGNRLAVGAKGDDGSSNSYDSTGAVYLFSFSDLSSSMSHDATIGKDYSGGLNRSISALDNYDYFGNAITLSDSASLMAVGALGDDGSSNGSFSPGAVYLLSFTDSSFFQEDVTIPRLVMVYHFWESRFK